MRRKREGAGGFGFFFVNAHNSNSPATSRKEIRSWVTSVQHSRKCPSDPSDHSITRHPHNDHDHGASIEEDREYRSIVSPTSSSSSRSNSGITPPPACSRKRKAPSQEPRFHEREQEKGTGSVARRALKYNKRSASPDSTSTCRQSSAGARAKALAASVLGIDTSTILLSNNLEDLSDPLRYYAKRLDMPASTLWTRYLWQESEHGRLFRAQYKHFGKGMAPQYLHPQMLAHPAMLSTTVLFSACHLRYTQATTHELSPVLLQIRSLAYGHVQAAINGEEQLEDSTFLAIIKLALWEVVFGSLSAFTVHMQGISQMVRLRGGLSNIGPRGYVGCILRWFDCNFAAVSRIPAFLNEETSLSAVYDSSLETDPDAFLLGVRTMEQWRNGD